LFVSLSLPLRRGDPGRHHRQRRRARARDLPRHRARPRRHASPAQRRLSRRLRRRARATDRLLRPPAAGLLQVRLEHLRLRRRRARVRPRATLELDAAADRAPRTRRARRPPPARPAHPAHGRPAQPASTLLHGAADDADPLRLRDGRLGALRRGAARGLGDDRRRDADALRHAHARELPHLHGSRHGRAPMVVGLLRLVHPRRRLHRPQRADRDRAQLDGGGTRDRAPARARRHAPAPPPRAGRGADLHPARGPGRARAGAQRTS
jgi:hypothetical protein